MDSWLNIEVQEEKKEEKNRKERKLVPFPAPSARLPTAHVATQRSQHQHSEDKTTNENNKAKITTALFLIFFGGIDVLCQRGLLVCANALVAVAGLSTFF